MTRGTRITVGFLLGVLVAGIALDIYIVARYGTAATISWVLYSAAVDHPMIPFAIGVLAGHLFWPQKTTTTPVVLVEATPTDG